MMEIFEAKLITILTLEILSMNNEFIENLHSISAEKNGAVQ